jgi:glycosyltransferase involved in cell wall biosynthesis
LIDICPFGIPDREPTKTREALRGVVEGIARDDKVVLWAGGVYNWFDPITLIRAIDVLRHDHRDVRLFFLGMKHPNPDVPDMEVAWRTRQLSEELGLTGKWVFFNDGWVDYDDRQNYLLDADVGVSTHFLNAETTFSFRTRILDYLWAGLPIVATEGDLFGELVKTRGLGIRVGEGDVEGLVAGLGQVLYDDAFAAGCRANVGRIRDSFIWSNALAPLLAFCADPRRAPDAGPGRRRLARRPLMPANPIARTLLRAQRLRHRGAMRYALGRVGDRLVANARRTAARCRDR